MIGDDQPVSEPSLRHRRRKESLDVDSIALQSKTHAKTPVKTSQTRNKNMEEVKEHEPVSSRSKKVTPQGIGAVTRVTRSRAQKK